MNDTTKSICKRLAQEGFSADAPGLYHGRIPQAIEKAARLSAEADSELVKTAVFLKGTLLS
ncbi:MAG: dienelactone hydrolase family protein [Anaerolinea sp.]|nr:dienelactone hydrolase family protein [Anaerolinea sp.]